jgi:hypothetical protein
LVVYAIAVTGRVMSRITFVEHDGTVHEVDVESGSSLMKAAIDNYHREEEQRKREAAAGGGSK